MARAVIPAILAKSEKDFVKKFEKIKAFAPIIHVDIMDGIFVPNNTWADPKKVPGILGNIPFEVHLMVHEPHQAITSWLKAGAARVIFHAEAVADEVAVCESFANDCEKLMVAINPGSALPKLFPAFGAFHQFMVMGVEPGWSGQVFNAGVLEKISTLRLAQPDAVITVDGGVKQENIGEIIATGANMCVVGSAIMEAEDPEAVYRELTK